MGRGRRTPANDAVTRTSPPPSVPPLPRAVVDPARGRSDPAAGARIHRPATAVGEADEDRRVAPPPRMHGRQGKEGPAAAVLRARSSSRSAPPATAGREGQRGRGGVATQVARGGATRAAAISEVLRH
jgi:hypothetical protein